MLKRYLLLTVILLSLMLQGVGHFFIFKVEQYWVKKEIKRQIKAGVPLGELVVLEIPLSVEKNHEDFEWIEGHEFRFHGVMYDIIRRDECGKTTFYYCITDTQETTLFAHLNEDVKKDIGLNPRRKKQARNSVRIMSSQFCETPDRIQFNLSLIKLISTSYIFNTKTWVSIPISPPPWVKL